MREEIEARPSAVLFVGLIFGLVALAFPVVLISAAGFAVWIRPMRGKCLLAGAFLAGLILSPAPAVGLRIGTPVHGDGTVASVPVLYPDAQECEIRIEGYTLLATMPREPGVMLGDWLHVSGIAKPLQSSVPRSPILQTVQGKVALDRVEIVREGPWLCRLADQWRRSFMTFLGRNLASKSADLVDALCFNARSMIDPQTRGQMASSGTVHIVSASGLQVFVFSMFVFMGLRFFPIARWVQLLVLAGVLLVYSLAAGLQPQIVRAAAMTLFGLTAYIVKRDADALSALSLSGIAYLLWRPQEVYGMAFQLSFVTVGCIALFFPRTPVVSAGWKPQLIRVTNDFLMVSAIVVLAVTPLVAYYLGVISVSSVLANIMLCWSLPLIVGAGFFAHAVSIGLPSVGDAIAGHCLSPLANWVYGVLSWLGDGSGTVQVPSFSALWLVAYYGAWLMTYRRRVDQP